MPEPAIEAIDAFIDRRKDSGGYERCAGHQFLLEFCEHLDLGKPDPSVAAQFAEVTKLIPATGSDPETISAAFGKKSKARTNEIKEIIETLKSLGKLG